MAAIPAEVLQKTTTQRIINDFAFVVATPNGSGSQTSNNVLVKTLFDMGIPVNGKNLFPSNIKGLPTWYTIRASKDGYTARRATTEIVVAYNLDTANEDVQNLPAGGVCIVPTDIRKKISPREDVIWYEVDIKTIMNTTEVPSDFKKRVENMTYVGVMAHLFGLPLDMIWTALLANFGGKEKPAKMNMNVIELAHQWSQENLAKEDPYHFEKMNATSGKILITGNEAGALGSVFGGVHVVAWYPITPSTSLVDGVINFQHLRRDADGKNTIAIVQAEDELAAAGMIVGAGFAGARSMTATSGPGISLMAEFTGLAYFAEIPCVIWDITRMGPSTGLPTRTSQGDILFAHFLGHGDTRQICLMPGSPEEAFEFGWRSFDIADQIQTPVFVVSDLDLGMNNWMSEPFKYPTEPINRGKVLDAEKLATFIKEHGKWGRYMDVDADGIGYRTVPGTNHPMAAYFARGTGHTEMAVYSERSDVWMQNMTRLRRKMETARHLLEKDIPSIVDYDPAKKTGIITFGTNEPAIIEARDWLKREGIETNYLRVRTLPLAEDVTEFIHNHDVVYVIENNFDGQLNQILHIYHAQDISHLTSLALGDGLPMTAKWIVDRILEMERH